jgi:indolepyruvate decarboxylase
MAEKTGRPNEAQTAAPSADVAPLTRRELIRSSAAALAASSSALAAVATPTTSAQAQPATVSIAEYILRRLGERDVKHLFGVPGVTCDAVFEAAARMGLTTVVTASDLEAGYAADGYARVRGMSAVAVTYGVGTLTLAPVVAGANAERVAMVVLNGGPSSADLSAQANLDVLFSHSTGLPDTDLTVFRAITAAAVRIASAASAPQRIDDAIRRARIEQRPIYIEVDRDLWAVQVPAPSGPLQINPAAGEAETGIARDILQRIRSSRAPVLLLGIEIARQRLAAEVETLVARLGVPYMTTLLSKSVIAETTTGFAGVYGSTHAPPAIEAAIEGADPLVALGTILGAQHRNLVRTVRPKLIRASSGSIAFGTEPKRPANLRRLIAALNAELASGTWRPDPSWIARARLPGLSFDDRRRSVPAPRPAVPPRSPAAAGMTYDAAMREVSAALDETLITITDTSLLMYPAADLAVKGAQSFLANGVWQSIGYSVAASVGVGVAQARRPLVLIGDGGFQMTAQALSTLARQKVRAIVLVFDNALYGIEQFLLRPSFFTNASAPTAHLTLNRWDYAALAKAMGCASGVTAATPAELRSALNSAKTADGPALIAVRIAEKDLPDGLPNA